MNATAQAAPEIINAPLGKVFVGKNYRHRHGPQWQQKLEELAQSMREKGQLQPILCRPRPLRDGGGTVGSDELEVVYGERRCRAATIAGFETVMTIVREMSDDDVLECQVAENNQREDPHPLDEAEGFAELVKRGRSPAAIAARLGRDASYVAKRIALLQLGKNCREALDEEQVTFSVALLLARIPDAKLQVEALRGILDDSYDGPMTVDDARKLIEQNYMLRLEQAAFDTADAALVPKAGPCTTCPKRTGVQSELFSDIKSPDLCTDPTCYRGKLDAVWQIRKKEAKAGGTPVLEGKEASEALHRHQGKFARLDQDVFDGKKMQPVRKILGKDVPPVTLARDEETGAVFEVVPRADVEKVLKAKGKDTARDSGGDSYKQSQLREQKKTKLRRKAIILAVEQGIAGVGKKPLEQVFALVVRAFAARAWNEVQQGILDRRGITVRRGHGAEAALLKLAKDLEGDELAGLGLELAMRAGAPWANYSSGNSECWRDALALMKIDFPALEKQVAAEAKEKKPKTKATPASKPKAKKVAKKKGRKS